MIINFIHTIRILASDQRRETDYVDQCDTGYKSFLFTPQFELNTIN